MPAAHPNSLLLAPPAPLSRPEALSEIRDGEPAPWTRYAEPVFLIGAPRGGTTWLQALLASHPLIHSGPETHFFSTFHPVELEFWRTKDRRLGISEYFTRDAFYQMIRGAFRQTVSQLPAPALQPRYLLEKTPHHCLSAEFILATFPQARFLHLVRDPRAVTASLLRISKSWGQDWAPGAVDDAARMWVERVTASRRVRELVPSAHQYTEVRYEDLRRDPEGRLADLFRWLELPADEELVRQAVGAHQVERARNSRQPFASIAMPGGRAVKAGVDAAYPRDFIGPAPVRADETALSPADRRRVEAIAGDLLCEYGYPTDDRVGATEPAESATPRFGASVLIVGEGDDPRPLLQRLGALAERWQEDWELVLVSRFGTACEQAAQHLDGDFQLLTCPPGADYADALNRATEAARADHLLIGFQDGALPAVRNDLLQAGGVVGCCETATHRYLATRGDTSAHRSL